MRKLITAIVISSASTFASSTAWGMPGEPVAGIEDLAAVRILESTDGVTTAHVMTGSALSSRRPGPLSASNQDFQGAANEHYDVFYSDRDGTFDSDGEYVTIEAVYDSQSPAQGGMNIAEVEFVTSATQHRYAPSLGTWRALGDNALQHTVWNVADGDPSTVTVMGNSVGQSQRLRITLQLWMTCLPILDAVDWAILFTESSNNTNTTRSLNQFNLFQGLLSSTFHDFAGDPTEYYDVYVSDPNGVFDEKGEFVTFRAIYNRRLPDRGGLNISHIETVYDESREHRCRPYVASFEARGDNAEPNSVGNAVDVHPATTTVLGNNFGLTTPAAPLRLTIGFRPEPEVEVPVNAVPATSPGSLGILGLLMLVLGMCAQRARTA